MGRIGIGELVVLVVILAICLGIFLLFREFWCWYWKINRAVDSLTSIDSSLKTLNDKTMPLIAKALERQTQLLIDIKLSRNPDNTRQEPDMSRSVTCPHCSKLTRIKITEPKALYTCSNCQQMFEVES